MSKPAFFLLIILICVVFFSFFGEGLPRFWYDDISHYKVATETSYISIIMAIADFTHKNVFMEGRITNNLISKLYLDLFGENLYLYRLMKMLIVSLGICMLSSLLLQERIRKSVVLPAFLVYMTSPVLFIGTIWIVVLGTWSLFFKVLSFFIFLKLYRDSHRGLRFYMLCAALLIVMMLGIKAREDFTLVPLVILGFLLVNRSKSLPLYLITAASIVVVFPYYAISWGSGGMSSHFHLSNLKMFQVYFSQIVIFIPFLLYSLYLYLVKKEIELNHTIIFSFIWVVFEVGMIFIYPSDEMRYLESLLLSSVFFFTAFIDTGFQKISRLSYTIVFLIFLLLVSYRIFENVRWDYNFRGSFGSYFITIDKQMKYVNENYNNTICFYRDFTLLYYAWKTTNHYVNLNPNNSWNMRFEDFYRYKGKKDGKINIDLVKPERFEHIILLDNSLPVQDQNAFIVFDGAGNTIFDRIQNIFNFKIHNVSLYNAKFGRESIYPAKRAINILR